MTVFSLSLNLGGSETRKTLKQKFILQSGTLNLHGINEALFIQQIYSCFLVTIFPPMAQSHFLRINTHTHSSLGCHATLPPGVINLGCKAHLKHCTKYAKHYESKIFLTIKILVTSCFLENYTNKHQLYRSIVYLCSKKCVIFSVLVV